MEVKIADLGLSRQINNGEVSKTITGTPLNSAPQVLLG
jgi:serine/threonine protein kinase